MKINQVIIASVFYTVSFNLYAIDVTRFQNACKDSLAYFNTQSKEYTHFGAGYCVGLIKGFSELSTYQNSVGINSGLCIPKNVSIKELTEVILNYIERTPALNLLDDKVASDTTIAYVAISEKYGCTSDK